MSQITINYNENDVRNYLCREGETISQAITRIIELEIKNKKLQKDLGGKN